MNGTAITTNETIAGLKQQAGELEEFLEMLHTSISNIEAQGELTCTGATELHSDVQNIIGAALKLNGHVLIARHEGLVSHE